MGSKWISDDANNHNQVDPDVVRPGFLDTLDTIPEDVSVAAAALQHTTLQSITNLSTASAVASSDSGRDDIKNDWNAASPGAPRGKQRRVGKRPRQRGQNNSGTPSRSESGGNDNLSDTHASLGGAVDHLERPSQQVEAAIKTIYQTSIVCSRKAVLFYMVVSLLCVVIGIGIYFIVAKVSEKSSPAIGSSSMTPTEDPTFPPYDFSGESFYPSAAPSYNQVDMRDMDTVLRQIPGIDFEKLNDTNTPEGQCRHWLTHIDDQNLRVAEVGVARVHQRYTLCVLYYYTNGDYWTVNSWLSGELHECDWHGVACNANDVAGITLKKKNLTGSLPDSIQSLSSLQLLRLHENSITNKIPEKIFETLPRLKWLDLSNNHITGTIPSKYFGNTSSELEVLYIKGNQLEGHLPFFPNIQRVLAQRNRLTSIDELYASSGLFLEFLYVYNNQLAGQLPSFWDTQNLQVLDLGFNNISGTLPQDLWDLPGLRLLIMDNNQITGILPTVSRSMTLTEVWLDSNQLMGPIPSSFGANWMNLTSLKLQDNNLTGSITVEHCNRWPLSSASTDWELEMDCSIETMDCSCCTKCFPAKRTRYLRR